VIGSLIYLQLSSIHVSHAIMCDEKPTRNEKRP
jgi:hypothetical protein